MQNQHKSSWIDDPFNLKGAFDGSKPVNHKTNLHNYSIELVSQYADYDNGQYNLQLDSIPEEDQNELVRLFLEATGRETTECVYGDDFTIESDFTCALLSMLQNDNPETREHFAEVTRKNTILYYKKSLQEILDEACHDFLCNILEAESNSRWGAYD